MNKSIALAAFAAVATGANAAIFLTSAGTAVTETFDALPTTDLSGQFSATIGVQSTVSGSTFDGSKIGGTGTTATALFANNGSSNSGGIHSVGATGSGERALGMIASSSNIMGVGVQIVNNTGVALESITLRFTQENWRSSTSAVNTMTFGWSTASNAATYLTDAGFNADSTLDLVGPAFVAANGALDGNDPLNQVSKLGTLTFATPLANGESVFIRWSDANDAGNDANIAIDDFSVVGNAVPEPATLAVLGLVAAAAARRNRK